jgi:hypothetical protein
MSGLLVGIGLVTLALGFPVLYLVIKWLLTRDKLVY